MKLGYKATYNLTCLDHKFEIGKTYELPKKPILCQYGFHYCVKPKDVLNYYSIQHDFRLLEVEDLSENTVTKYDKSVTDKIRIIKEIPKEEYYSLFRIVDNVLNIVCLDGYCQTYKYDERNNQIYYETSDGFWKKCEYDERNNLIRFENSTGYWEKFEFDQNNNQIYNENSTGRWRKYEFDERNNCVSYKKSNEYWEKSSYDDRNNKTSFENSIGYWMKIEYDQNNNEISYKDGQKYN